MQVVQYNNARLVMHVEVKIKFEDATALPLSHKLLDKIFSQSNIFVMLLC